MRHLRLRITKYSAWSSLLPAMHAHMRASDAFGVPRCQQRCRPRAGFVCVHPKSSRSIRHPCRQSGGRRAARLLWQVRDYLEMEFRPKSSEAPLPFGFDLERIIDDFVLFCMLIGNDFLPCASC